jgi:putative membrane protein
MGERLPSPRQRLQDIGEEPDARFSFANERTYLAWNRTALGCVVAGLAVVNVLTPKTGPRTGPEILGIMLMALGLILTGVSYRNWYTSERALRLGQPLPHSPLLLILSIVTGVVAVGTAIYTLA